MTPSPIVKDFDVIEDISPGKIPGFVDALADAFLFQAAEERFGDRIIQQLPRLLMLGSRLLALQKRRQSSLPYWLPWSECAGTGFSGLRRQTAISKAASTVNSRLSRATRFRPQVPPASTSSALCFSSFVGMTALTHSYKPWADTPSRAATSGTGVAPSDDLTNCFFLKFRRVTLCAHSFLLCSNHRLEMSTGVGEVQTVIIKKEIGRIKVISPKEEFRLEDKASALKNRWLEIINKLIKNKQ